MKPTLFRRGVISLLVASMISPAFAQQQPAPIAVPNVATGASFSTATVSSTGPQRTPVQVESNAQAAANDAALMSVQGVSNNVTAMMNRAADYTAKERVALVSKLNEKPLKTNLQKMTCLDLIMAIQFMDFGSFSISGVVSKIIQAAITALLNAACALIEQAFDSAIDKLSSMTTIDMGAAGSVSFVQGGSTGSGLGVSVAPSWSGPNMGAIGGGGGGGTFGNTFSQSFNSDLGAIKSEAMGDLKGPGTGTSQVYNFSAGVGGGGSSSANQKPAQPAQPQPSSWDSLKNMFK